MKQPDAFKHQREVRRRAYALTASLRDRFPKVEQLVIQLSFTDAQRLGIYSPQMHSFAPAAKAFFAIACPRTFCVEGGFDLDAIVARMLAAAQAEISGTMMCGGWQGSRKNDGNRCLLQLNYRLTAIYADE
jgi:hypothetical protein